MRKTPVDPLSPDRETCSGCGASFPVSHGPVHPYMTSSPGCWAAFGEVLAREYSDPAYFDIHRLSVDSYAAQHPGGASRQSIQSVGLHLVRLCLFLEQGLTPEAANDAMLAAEKIKSGFTWLEPPTSLGNVTVNDVAQTSSMAEHKAMVRVWAEAAWRAWTPHHSTVYAWVAQSRGQ